MDYKCPICGTAVVEDYRDYIEHTLCESADHCPCGCYSFDFAYGASRERIGEVEWQWSYNESQEDWDKRRVERQAVIEEIRRNSCPPLDNQGGGNHAESH
jgi:hypothetical protein